MPRPTRHIIPTQEGWDAEVDANFDILFDGPLPLFRYTGSIGQLFTNYPPTNYSGCLVVLDQGGVGTAVSLFLSTGSTWEEQGNAAHTHTGVYAPVSHNHIASEVTGTVLAADATLWDGATKTTSTSNPSGGVNGDIHFEHEV